MGFFGKKAAPKKAASETKAVKVVRTKKEATPAQVVSQNVSGVLLKPHITEKAAVLTDGNVYTFEIKKGASKYDVRDAVQKLYNITPTKVHIVNKQPRHSMSRSKGRNMMEHGMRKAYVYLKKGDRIELI